MVEIFLKHFVLYTYSSNLFIYSWTVRLRQNFRTHLSQFFHMGFIWVRKWRIRVRITAQSHTDGKLAVEPTFLFPPSPVPHYLPSFSFIPSSLLVSFFFLLGMEPRALNMSDKCSATELYPNPEPKFFVQSCTQLFYEFILIHITWTSHHDNLSFGRGGWSNMTPTSICISSSILLTPWTLKKVPTWSLCFHNFLPFII